MNWSGTQRGEGYEFHLLALGLGAVILIMGSGALSVDRWLSDRGSSGVVKMYRSTLRKTA
jgi:putative oxidoreductase